MVWSTFGGVRPVNVFHLITSSTNETEIGEEVDLAFNAGTSQCFAGVSSQYTVDFYQITLLDGASATIIVDATHGVGGLASGAPIPQVAAVLSLRTPQRGARGRGRLYMGPLSEGVVDNGIVESSVRADFIAGWTDFEAELTGSPIAASLGVASYVHAEVNGVTSISMRPQSGTQRRRQDQLV